MRRIARRGAANRSTCGFATSGARTLRPSSARFAASTTGSPTSASRSAGIQRLAPTWSWARPDLRAVATFVDRLPAGPSPAALAAGCATTFAFIEQSQRPARDRDRQVPQPGSRTAPRSLPSSSTLGGALHRSSAPTRGASSRARPGCPAAGRRSWPSSMASLTAPVARRRRAAVMLEQLRATDPDVVRECRMDLPPRAPARVSRRRFHRPPSTSRSTAWSSDGRPAGEVRS